MDTVKKIHTSVHIKRLIVALLLLGFFCLSKNTVYAGEPQQNLVDYFVTNEYILEENISLAEAIARGTGDEMIDSIFTELLISYESIEPSHIDDVRAYVGAEPPSEAVLDVSLSSSSPVASILEVDAIDDTESIMVTVFTLTASVGSDIEVFELPVRASVEMNDVDDVVKSVKVVIDGELYDADTIYIDGTSGLATFYFGATHGKSRLVIPSGDSVEVSVVVSLYGQAGRYQNGETVNAYISDSELGGLVVKKMIPNSTPTIVAELLIEKGIVGAELEVSVDTLASSFSDSESAQYIEACISDGLVATGVLESARQLLYENMTVTLAGFAIGETHILQSPGIYADNASVNMWKDSFGGDDDVFGIFEIQFDVTAFVQTYCISATTTSVFDITIKNDEDDILPVVTSTAVLSIQSSVEQTGGAYCVEAGDSESFILLITIHPGSAGNYRAQLNSIDFGTSALNTTGETAHEVSPPDEFETENIFLEADSVFGVAVHSVTANSVVLTWMTAYPATSRVLWSTSSYTDVAVSVATPNTYGYTYFTAEDISLVTEHSVLVNTLSPSTMYYFRPISKQTIESMDVFGTEIFTSTLATSGGGGGGNINDKYPPTNTNVSIENDLATTTKLDVFLTVNAVDPSKPITMQVSNTGVFTDTLWVPYRKNFKHTLLEGEGVKIVSVRFRDSRGNISDVVTDTIWYEAGPAQGRVRGLGRYYFSNDIGLGMENTDVVELQKRLKEEGFFTYPTMTGYYGVVTKSAVESYQINHDINPTGYVGPLTRAELNKSIDTEEGVSIESFVRLLIALGIISQEKAAEALSAIETL